MMKELNVMLVDDDRIILEDLRSIINWNANGLRVVAAAPNGKKALELYRRHMPDIVITDIKMPIMDGMELVDKIREISTDTEILLLTSYQEFEYAKKAIQQGVSDYYLKNDISEESFLEKVLSMKKIIKKQRESHRQSFHHMIEDLLTGNLRDTSGITDPQARDILLKEYYFLLVDVRLPLLFGEEGEDDNKTATVALSKKLNELWTAGQDVFFHAVGRYHILTAIAPEDSRSKPLDIFQKISSWIERVLHEDAQPSCCFGYFLPCRSVFSYLKEFYPALLRRHDAAFFKKGMLYPLETRSECPGTDAVKKIIWKLHEQMEQLDEAQLHGLADDFFDHAMQSLDFHSIQNLCNQSALFFEEYWQKQNFPEEKSTRNISSCQAIYTAEDMRQWFFESFQAIFLYRKKMKNRGYCQSTQNAISYIKEQFSQPELSIAKIARHVCLSSGRLSVLFKKETGKTVNEYITKARIERAGELLISTPLKVYEIAEQVGYGSGQYFSQIFLQYTGLKPNDYRHGRRP